jgi:hypothetical protein
MESRPRQRIRGCNEFQVFSTGLRTSRLPQVTPAQGIAILRTRFIAMNLLNVQCNATHFATHEARRHSSRLPPVKRRM